MKIEFFKKEKIFRKHVSRLNPNFFWKLSIFTLLVIVTLAAFFGTYLFVQINRDPPWLANDNVNQADTVKKERVSQVLEHFSDREKKSNDILNSRSPVTDPSL